jgi:hypothetical protein
LHFADDRVYQTGAAGMSDLSDLRSWDRVEVLPDGRYLLMHWNRGTRVANADGSHLIEPSPSEIVALQSLLDMRFQKTCYWERADAIDDEEEENLD